MEIKELEYILTNLIKEKTPIVIGIDGQSFSGKTSLAHYISKHFPSIRVISLDSYMTEPTIRKQAFIDPLKRIRLFDYWYDKEKINTVDLKTQIIIEGTFLLTALTKEHFDILLTISPRISLKTQRVQKSIKRNPLLSSEEAEILDEIYTKAWYLYEDVFYKNNPPQYIAIPDHVFDNKKGL